MCLVKWLKIADTLYNSITTFQASTSVTLKMTLDKATLGKKESFSQTQHTHFSVPWSMASTKGNKNEEKS